MSGETVWRLRNSWEQRVERNDLPRVDRAVPRFFRHSTDINGLWERTARIAARPVVLARRVSARLDARVGTRVRELVGKSFGPDPDGPAPRYLLIFIAARNVYGPP